VAGIDAVGRPISEAAHRPQLVAQLLAKGANDPVTAADLAALTIHPRGGLKGVPASAKFIPAINKVESEAQLAAAREAARAMLEEPRVRQVALTAAEQPQPVIEVWRRVTAVILAAGESSRMGSPKMLLPWGDTTVLGRTIAHVQDSAVFDALVVSGAAAEAVAPIVEAAGLPLFYNAQYASGEMLSSLQTALRALPPAADAVLVVLGDQPLVEAETINEILVAYAQGRGTIIAPQYNNRRGNPVLIDRRHFEALLALPAGAAPRDLLRREPVHMVEVCSESVLLDIDDPETYEQLKP
jgi:molybdenum cofactor cytidylyltransferase